MFNIIMEKEDIYGRFYLFYNKFIIKFNAMLYTQTYVARIFDELSYCAKLESNKK